MTGARTRRRPELESRLVDDTNAEAQHQPVGPGWRQHVWRNRPCCFLHFELWHALRGRPIFPSTARPAALGGLRGDLALATSAGLACLTGSAGVYFCNHVRFRWKQGGSWFVATLHSFGNRETTALLSRIIRELRPIEC